LLGGKARAVLMGRRHVAAEDIRALAHPVLRHRLVTSFSAEAEGNTPDRIIDQLLTAIDPNATPLDDHEHARKVLST
ncbi:MAG: AAA family ATPase, partial [Phycisphaerae bacterium]